MSDIDIQLLEQVDVRLTAEIMSGGALEDAGSHFVMYTNAETPPEYGSLTPIIFAKMGDITGEPISIPQCMWSKDYPLTFSILTENAGDTELKSAAELLNAIEDIFITETFDLSEGIIAVSKSHGQNINLPFSGEWNGYGELVLIHRHIDMRNIITFHARPSDVVTLTGLVSCISNYQTIRVIGDGDITMTVTPNLTAGLYDGVVCILQGTDDSNTVTFQDESNLAGSKLKLKNARDMTLGKNDNLALSWSAINSEWIELWRSDNY